MKRAVLAVLSFGTPAKRDQLFSDLKQRIAGKLVWAGVSIEASQNIDSKPTCNVEIRFDDKADGDDLFRFIKQSMDLLPVLKGFVSVHTCYHDEGIRPCVIEDEFVK